MVACYFFNFTFIYLFILFFVIFGGVGRVGGSGQYAALENYGAYNNLNGLM